MIDFVYYSKSTTTATTGSPAIAEKSNSKKTTGTPAIAETPITAGSQQKQRPLAGPPATAGTSEMLATPEIERHQQQ
jgi:hypothetical protein